jgi:bacillithiol biosynthesis deacetylase BshB1
MPAFDVVAIGAHPDDVELQMGGTVLLLRALGYSVALVDLTRGEMGTRGTAEIRALEAEKAAGLLGVAERRTLDLGDGHLEVNDASKDAVIRVYREFRPTIVLAPWIEDRHPDHGAAGRLAASCAFLAGLARWETGQAPHRPRQVLHAMFHTVLEPSIVVDTTAWFEQKRAAVLAFESQFHNPASTERETYISSPDFFHWWEGRQRYFGQMIGARYGEGFRIAGPIPVADPVALFRGKAGRT